MEELSKLGSWFAARPVWLQSTADRLRTQDSLSEQDILELANHCLAEAQGELDIEAPSFSLEEFTHTDSHRVKLGSIEDVNGINALAPTEPLSFSTSDLVVVYGPNGSGKSGYTRILKSACGARKIDDVFGNVYKHNEEPKTATFVYDVDEQTRRYTWPETPAPADLHGIEIFDSSYGDVFCSGDDEVCYEPPVLEFFSKLVDACGAISEKLKTRKSLLVAALPAVPAQLSETSAATWFGKIAHDTSSDQIDTICKLEEGDETRKTELTQRLAMSSPNEGITKLRREIEYLEHLQKDATRLTAHLSDSAYSRLAQLRQAAADAKRDATKLAATSFADSVLDGVGSTTWKTLWNAAKEYSENFAYKDREFPNISDQAACVLCHQPLEKAAKARLSSFESFVTSQLSDAVMESEEAVRKLTDIIANFPDSDQISQRLDATNISDPSLREKLSTAFADLRVRQDIFLRNDERPLPGMPAGQTFDCLNDLITSKTSMIAELQQDLAKNNRSEAEREFNELRAREWVAENKAAVLSEVDRRRQERLIELALGSINTATVSRKKGDLAEKIVTEAFVDRFNNEIAQLGASHIGIELVKTGVSKGRVLHRIRLSGVASTTDLEAVLSEGERRIVSIAAFLADTTGKNMQSPFVFDDPISSLDQDYEENVIKRLVEDSKKRQIIIFTHRLSLLGTVKSVAEKAGLKPRIVSIRSTPTGTGQPAPIPISQSDIKTALNRLINDRMQHANKAQENQDFDQLDRETQSICSDFRVIIERSIETDLLRGVVERFQRPIRTLKLKELTRMRPTDCEFIDNLMTKYSAFEHSQPGDSPIKLPSLEDVQADMQALKSWRDEYTKRPNATTEQSADTTQ